MENTALGKGLWILFQTDNFNFSVHPTVTIFAKSLFYLEYHLYSILTQSHLFMNIFTEK